MRRVILFAVPVVFADQITKTIAAVGTGADASPAVIDNAGSLAGIIPVDGLPLLVLAGLGLAGFIAVGNRLLIRGRIHPSTLGLLAGGATGNLIDRVVLGSVRDFIWTRWLVINLADLALFLGAVLFIAAVYSRRRLDPVARL